MQVIARVQEKEVHLALSYNSMIKPLNKGHLGNTEIARTGGDILNM